MQSRPGPRALQWPRWRRDCHPRTCGRSAQRCRCCPGRFGTATSGFCRTRSLLLSGLPARRRARSRGQGVPRWPSRPRILLCTGGEMAATARARAPRDIQGNCFKFIFGDFLRGEIPLAPVRLRWGQPMSLLRCGLAGRLLAAAVPRGCSAIHAAIGRIQEKGPARQALQRAGAMVLQAYMPA